MRQICELDGKHCGGLRNRRDHQKTPAPKRQAEGKTVLLESLIHEAASFRFYDSSLQILLDPDQQKEECCVLGLPQIECADLVREVTSGPKVVQSLRVERLHQNWQLVRLKDVRHKSEEAQTNL